jgi:hypothetical protein
MSAAALALAMTLGACRDNPLAVNNSNNPDVSKVYGTPRDVETIMSKLFQQMWNAQQGQTGNVGVQTMTMSLESASGLANFALGARMSIPRGTISNALGNANQAENFTDFDGLSRNSRSAANAVAALRRFQAAGNSTGSNARDARAISFGFFSLGYALGNLALLYDSAAIITPAVPSDVVPPLSEDKAVMTTALAMLDSALAVSASPAATDGANGFPIPTDWISGGGTTIPIPRWQQIIHSFKARFRAGITRTPTERAAIDWNALIADATAGITSDFIVNADATNGWGLGWRSQLAVDPTWSQMSPFYLGMGDTTLAYDAWLATSPIDNRAPFLMRTPDKRFPSGDTRPIQQAVTGNGRGGTPTGSVLYFRNRPTGEDSPITQGWANWFYDNWRFWAARQAGGNGPIVELSVAENDLLAAEGYLRTSKIPQAAALIDKTRLVAGLPSVAAITNLTDPVPGGSACVPRVPQPPNYTTTACGNIFEAMKWEKRLETSFTGYAQWYIDSRGWGDLVQGTQYEWAVPWQELSHRLSTVFYTTSNSRAVKGTYGF